MKVSSRKTLQLVKDKYLIDTKLYELQIVSYVEKQVKHIHQVQTTYHNEVKVE